LATTVRCIYRKSAGSQQQQQQHQQLSCRIGGVGLVRQGVDPSMDKSVGCFQQKYDPTFDG
jgi:hypothetical protein